MSHALAAVWAQTCAFLGAHRAPLVQDFAQGVRAAEPHAPASPSLLPVVSMLQGPSGHASPLLAALSQAAPFLCWRQTYTADDFGADFLQGYGWTILQGPGGLVEDDRLLVAVLMLGGGILYPAHRHAAEELYLPLWGTARWMAGTHPDSPWVPRSPGEAIHHPPWLWHGIEAGSEGLIALVLWRNGPLVVRSEVAE